MMRNPLYLTVHDIYWGVYYKLMNETFLEFLLTEFLGS